MDPHPSEGGPRCNMVPNGTTNKKFTHRDKSTQRKFPMQHGFTQCNMAPHPDGGGVLRMQHVTCNMVHTVQHDPHSATWIPTPVKGGPPCNMVPNGTTNKKFTHRDKSTQRKFPMQHGSTQCNMAPHPDGGGD